MAKDIHRSNPTRLVAVPRKAVEIEFTRDSNEHVVGFVINRLDIEGQGFGAGIEADLVAYDKMSEERFELGTVESLRLPERWVFAKVDPSSVTFRILFRTPGSARLAGSCEGLKPRRSDDGDYGREPLLHVEYEDLGQLPWQLAISATDAPVLLVNDREGLGLKEAFEARDTRTRGLVLPAAIEKVLLFLAWVDRDESEDGWQVNWWKYLSSIGAPDLERESEDFDMDAATRWARDVCHVAAGEWQFVNNMINTGDVADE